MNDTWEEMEFEMTKTGKITLPIVVLFWLIFVIPVFLILEIIEKTKRRLFNGSQNTI